MRLWQRVAGALKDRSSILLAQLSRRSSFRHPDLEAAIIKATSHDEHQIDCKNVQRVFRWVRTSPLCLRPLIWALTRRMEKTRSWVVAIKGLMLMHGIFCCDIANVQKMGPLPFDLSNFRDGYTNPEKVGVFNEFVRSYFAYLDQKSAFMCKEYKKQCKRRKTEETLMEELERLQAMQGLIDMLLVIKPENMNLHVGLILEAMDCVIVELFDVYSKFCKGIARALLRIHDIGGKEEAGVGLQVLKKAATQSDDLSLYFDFCREIGVLNAAQCPKMENFPEGYMQDLERIMSGDFEMEILKGIEEEQDKAVFTKVEVRESPNGLKTVITDKWEVFEDEFVVLERPNAFGGGATKLTFSTNPFEEPCSYTIVPYHAAYNQVVPDLISL